MDAPSPRAWWARATDGEWREPVAKGAVAAVLTGLVGFAVSTTLRPWPTGGILGAVGGDPVESAAGPGAAAMTTPMAPEPPGGDMDPTDAQAACFEAGVKFGSLYHQFAGAPVSPESAASLAAAIEESIENQPGCREVTVDADLAAIRDAAGDAGYTEFTGALFEAEVVVDHGGVEVVARMAMEDGYPLMRVVAVRD